MPTPSVRLVPILKDQKALTKVLAPYVDTMISAEQISVLLGTVSAVLPGVRHQVLADSIVGLVETRFSKEDLRELAWRLAGNKTALLKGLAVYRWHRQTHDEWCAGHISAARWRRSRTRGLGAHLNVTLLSGSAASLRAETWWSLKFMRYAARQLGFPFRGPLAGRCTLRHPLDLVGLRMIVKLDPAFSDERPGFRSFDMTSSMLAHNRKLVQLRFRIALPCPENEPDDFPCRACPVGYDQCRAATHRRHYVRRACPKCKEETWFDPDRADKECLACSEAMEKADPNAKQANNTNAG